MSRYFHYQNLNVKRGQKKEGSILRHGRCWLYFYRKARAPQNIHHPRQTWRLEWEIPTRHCQVAFSVLEHDDTIGVDFACWFFALWFSIQHWGLSRWLEKRIGGKGYIEEKSRELKISIHSGSLWWSLWHPTMSWSGKTPRWRHGCFDPVDFLFGRTKYEESDYRIERVVVPMPEGGYPATVRIFEARWRRPRWPWVWSRLNRAEVTPDTPIAHPGKGENSYDCGEDASFSLTCKADTALEAALEMCRTAMRHRLRYGGGWNYQPQEKWAQRQSV